MAEGAALVPTKLKTIAALELEDAVTLAADPALVLALARVRLHDGRDERYQLVLRFTTPTPPMTAARP